MCTRRVRPIGLFTSVQRAKGKVLSAKGQWRSGGSALCSLLFALCAHAGQPPSSPWVLYKWGNSGKYNPYNAPGSGGDLSTFNFPATGNNVAYPAFLTTTTATNDLGDLSGKTITASFNLETTGNPGFRFGGQGVWNFGSLPANTRLFISTSSAPYSNAGYTACPSCYWWSTVAWVQISSGVPSAILQDTFDPSHWSNAQGQSGSSLPTEFAAAIANVHQIGLAYGGGSFYDCGIAITNGTGAATFHLLSFDVQ